MNIIDNLIFARYKDTDFPSYGCYLKILKCKESKLYDKINLYPVYVEIINYQIKTYGTSLCNAYENNNVPTRFERLYESQKARSRRYERKRRRYYE